MLIPYGLRALMERVIPVQALSLGAMAVMGQIETRAGTEVMPPVLTAMLQVAMAAMVVTGGTRHFLAFQVNREDMEEMAAMVMAVIQQAARVVLE